MDFAMAKEYIDEKNKLGIVPGLDNVRELLSRLGNPQNNVRCLHIAGTNGKGSIFSFVEGILIEAGYRVGRYVSPTIFDYLERFQVDRSIMDEDTFASLVAAVKPHVDEMTERGNSPTAFEIETAIAFLYFDMCDCDIMLIECGMGGREDATNVFEAPLACVMASISLDHMQFLGATISEITRAKAGIIKEKGICVSYPQGQEARTELERCCEERSATLRIPKTDELLIKGMDVNGADFSYKNIDYHIRLLGVHQVYNAVTAIEVIDYINSTQVFDISTAAVKKGLDITGWQGRMTKVCDSPLVFVDGAHNEDAWLMLKKTVNKYFTNKRIIYIMGVLKDKEYVKMIDILCPTMKYVIAVTPENERGLDKDILRELAAEREIPAVTADNADEAMHKALGISTSDDVIIVCGSLSFIAPYLNFFDNNIRS